jgi:hypothetical protein
MVLGFLALGAPKCAKRCTTDVIILSLSSARLSVASRCKICRCTEDANIFFVQVFVVVITMNDHYPTSYVSLGRDDVHKLYKCNLLVYSNYVG